MDKVKEGFKKAADKVEDVAEKVTDSDTYTGTNDKKRSNENPAGGKEPMIQKI